MLISRAQVIQAMLDRFVAPSYLEVGVNQGQTFRVLKAPRKVAVDPNFLFDTAAEAGPGIAYHEVTSDEYFASRVSPGERFDVIYLDGLHTFEQTLRDLMSATVLVPAGGVIVIDDTIPNCFDASLPDLDEVHRLREAGPPLGANWWHDGCWMGDVFKLVFFVETFMQQWSYATIADNHGQTVLWRKPRPVGELPQRSVEQVSRLDYRDTILRRDAFRCRPLADILAAMTA